MCSEDSCCLFEMCDICNELVDALDMIVVDSQIICCDCYNEYMDEIENSI